MMFRPWHDDYRTTLALIATLPVLVFCGLIALFGYFSTSLPALAWPGITIFAVILSMISKLIYQHLVTHFLQPLSSISAVITTNGKPCSVTASTSHQSVTSLDRLENSQSLTALPTRLKTFLTIQQAATIVAAKQATRQLQRSEDKRRFALQRKLTRIEQALDLVEKQNIRLTNDQKSDREEQLQLSYLINNSLQSITGFTNLLGGTSPNATLKKQIHSSATQLLFYQAEITTRMTPGFTGKEPNSEAEFSLRDAIDDVIALLQPLLTRYGCELLPVYDRLCQHDLIGNELALKSIIFNYLLACLTAAPPQSLTTFLLHISRMADNQFDNQLDQLDQLDNQHQCLRLSLDSAVRQTISEPTARLSQLVDSIKGEIKGNGLYIPVNCTSTTIRLAPAGLTATVHGRNPRQAYGLSHRLEQLGIEILEPGSAADLCFIGHDEHAEILSITASLATNTDVLLLNNTRTLSRSDWLVMPQPLRQSELIRLLTNKYSLAAAQQLNILVVDDDLLARQFLATLLRQSGYNVLAASDGEQAISCVISQTVDLIFMDIHMPHMNGLEAIQELRTTYGLKLPIIALTAHLLNSERAATIAAGANEILIKPLTIDYLNQNLTTWISGEFGSDLAPGEAFQAIPIFDRELAFRIANQQPDLALEMLDLFMQSLPQDRAKLKQGITDNNIGLMREVVHRLNGACQFCGIPRVQSTIDRLETLIKADAAKDLPIALHQAQQELDALEQWYRETPNPLLEIPRTNLRQLPGNT